MSSFATPSGEAVVPKGQVMRWIVPFCALLALTSIPGVIRADEMDGWCAQAKKASSIVICSDPELRQQALTRNKLFDAAKQKLTSEDYTALNAEQTRWVKSYTARCGIGLDDPA